MKLKDKQETIERYNRRLEKYGYDPKTLGWLKNRQGVRFEALSKIGCLDGCSVIDVGCGFGDLYAFLKSKGLKIDYTGYDINPSLIEIAEGLYTDACFEVKDIEEETTNRQFDWVLSSGVFNFRLSDNESFIKSMLTQMFSLCRKGMAVDFFSSYVDYENRDGYYSSPEEIFGFCKSLSKRVSIKHDYMPYEFCIYVYKNDRINERNIFHQHESEKTYFVFTCDIDWAPEWAIEKTLSLFKSENVPLTPFITHESEAIKREYANPEKSRYVGLHPNFRPKSSHGDNYIDVIDFVTDLWPESRCFRSHCLSEDSYIIREFYDRGFKYDSNLCFHLQPSCFPIVHPSGLLRFPFIWSDDSKEFSFKLNDIKYVLETPGLKIFDIHPIHLAKKQEEQVFLKELIAYIKGREMSFYYLDDLFESLRLK